MPNPKRRHSNTRSRLRRAHDAVKIVSPSKCPQCGSPVISHRVCKSCGYYRGRQVISIKMKKEKAEK